MWRRIAKCAFAWFASIYIISAASVLAMVINRHTRTYQETLNRLSLDCRSEYESHGGDVKTMRALFKETAEEHGNGNVFLIVTESDGRIVIDEESNAGIAKAMRSFATAPGRTCRVTGEEKRVGPDSIAVRVRKTPLSDGRILIIGFNVTENERVAIGIALVLGLALLLSLAASLVLSVMLARRFTSPLERISAAARDIAEGDYSARVPITYEGREITELEESFNTMGAAAERTLCELRRITDDIAHDMRTPLARLRAAAEVEAMNGHGSGTLPENVMEETAGLLDMINTALAVSQTENIADTTPREEIDLSAFVGRMADLYSAPAEDACIDFSVNLPTLPVFVLAHKAKLQQLVGNLMDNALKFTPRGGRVTVSVKGDPVELEVANTGPGIDEADIPHVFSRFWRAQKSRSLPGNGLGLALVKAIAQSYGASVTCVSSSSGPTTFSVRW